LLKDSDVINDTTYLELNDITDGHPKGILFGEKAENGELRFLSLQHLGQPAEKVLLIPLPLVEEFISWMKERL